MICSKAEILVYLRKADTTLSGADDALLDLLHPLVESAVQNYLQKDLNYTVHTEYLPVGVPEIPQDYPLEDYKKQGNSFVYQGRECGAEAVKVAHTPVALTGLRVWEDVSGYAGQGASAFGDDSELTVGTDFFLDVSTSNNLSTSGLLYRIGGWPKVPRSIKVQYYGGYTAQQLVGRMAGALKLGTLQQIAFEFNATKRINTKVGTGGPFVRERIGKWEGEMSESMAEYVMGITGRDLLPKVKDVLHHYKAYEYL